MFRFASLIPAAAAIVLTTGCAQTTSDTIAEAGPNTPGWTGRTHVIGNTSTIAGDAQATEWAQKWGIGRQK